MSRINIKFGKFENFSSARNKSFEMATGKYIFWLDVDDFLNTPQLLRDLIRKHPDIDVFRCQLDSMEFGRVNTILQPRLVKNV